MDRRVVERGAQVSQELANKAMVNRKSKISSITGDNRSAIDFF